MTRKLDHPIRLARQRAGVTQSGLARTIGVTRAAVTALEEGRTKMPKPETLDAIAKATRVSATSLRGQLLNWLATQEQLTLSTKARATLQLDPRHLAYYDSFTHWRQQIVDTPTAFASLLRVNTSVVTKYEQGLRPRGMSDKLAGAILTVLGVSDDYLAQLQKLPTKGN